MKKGFTLAEILITIGIIAIVVSMVLPTLINNKQNKELEVGLKKNYSVLSQALDMYQAKNEERLSSDFLIYHELKDILMSYMNVIVDCKFGTEADNSACIPQISNDPEKSSKVYKNFNASNYINLSFFDDGQFIISDGSLILLQNSTSGGNKYISVDVNGYLKGPNRLGRDLFMFQLDNNGKLLPMGAKGSFYFSKTDAYCSKTSTNNMNGAGCTINALTDKNYFKNLP